MNVILNSNAYISDYRMEYISFKNLFDYLKRTGGALVLLRIVREEVVAHFGRDLKKRANEAEKAWKAYRHLHFPEKLPEFTESDIEDQKRLLRARLMKPSDAVKVTYHKDTSKISVEDVFIRGIHRIPPANGDGEELRDVIMWLSTLDYAKSSNLEAAFITNDSGFWANDAPRPEIQEDIKKAGVAIRLYRNIDKFVEENSPDVKVVGEKWAYEAFPEFSDDVIAAAESAIRSRAFGGTVSSVSLKSVQFKEGKLFEVAPDVQVAELLFSVNIEYHTRTVMNLVPLSSLAGAVDSNSYWRAGLGLGPGFPAYGPGIVGPIGLGPNWVGPATAAPVHPTVVEAKYRMSGTVRAFARLLKGKVSEKEITEFQIEKIDQIEDAAVENSVLFGG